MADSRGDTAFWFRRHRGGLASVTPIAGKADRFMAGAPTASQNSPYEEILGLDNAKRHADRMSGCRQPCDCPAWATLPDSASAVR